MKFELFKKRFFEGAPRYKWLETLGRGGAGVVFKAFDQELEEAVAIKVLSPSIDRDEAALLARFKREIQLNRKIKHPNVARMFDYGVSGDFPYITMEFIPGKDLWTLVTEKGRLTPKRAVPILRQIVMGVAAIHRLEIIHRDLKSQNVIVDSDGGVAIVDFGLARGSAEDSVSLHQGFLGTPQYMSPEQALGRPLDARSDIYSIGVIAFEILTGEVPFTGDSPVSIAMRHVTDEVPDLLSPIPEVSPELRRIVLTALDKEPERRFGSAEEMETALALLDQKGLSNVAPSDLEAGANPFQDQEKLASDLDTAINAILVPARVDPAAVPLREMLKAPPVPRPTRAPQALPPPGQPVPLVMVVEEEVGDLLRLAMSVCQAGCKTLEVRSGREALEAVLVEKVDLVLMAAKLPDIDGFDVSRILKSRPELARIPVLLFTERPDRTALVFAIQTGAAGLLPKPVPQQMLTQRIWQILQYQDFTPPPGVQISSGAFNRLRGKK
ncbi:MAG: protein kinase [Acidobacteria bacterium]|nr:protein kinase [Acidobacteriota bacterium]MCG3193874.1 Serine/threonine-protein kinase PknD [Thermoanaerobaculia bacterium]MCK6681363.1 protein kinase [Thermoanaerobaculia bacterium]